MNRFAQNLICFFTAFLGSTVIRHAVAPYDLSVPEHLMIITGMVIVFLGPVIALSIKDE